MEILCLQTLACNLRKQNKPTSSWGNEFLHSDQFANFKTDQELKNILETHLTDSIVSVSAKARKTFNENEYTLKVPLWQPCCVVQNSDLVDYYKKLSKFRLTSNHLHHHLILQVF